MYFYIVSIVLIVILLVWKFSKSEKTAQIPIEDISKKYPYVEYVDTTPWKNWKTFKFLLHE